MLSSPFIFLPRKNDDGPTDGCMEETQVSETGVLTHDMVQYMKYCYILRSVYRHVAVLKGTQV